MKTNDKKKRLTSENGRPIADNQNIQTAGQRGPVTLQDPWFLEKLAHFDREVIPGKGGRCLRNLHSDPRHLEIYESVDLFGNREADPVLRAIFDSGRGAWCCRCRA